MRSKRLTAKYGSKTESRKGGALDPDEVQKYKDALEQWEVNLRLEKEKMVLVSLGLPEGVIFLENPTVCMWNEEKKSWWAGDIYEVDHEHSERRITFRVSRFGLFSLAVRKYQNYPYKSWDIRPNDDDSISIVLEGSRVTVNLTIQESDIKVVDFEYRLSDYLVGERGLNSLKSKSWNLPRFIEMMQRSGLDMFPDHDANCYYTATMEKHWPTAYVAYHAMAQTAIRYNFSRSKWNSESGRRSIVLRLREYDPTDEAAILRTFDLVQVTPLRSQVLVCTEDDENFSDEASILYKFQPNLQYLLKSMSKVTNRAKINDFSPTTIHTLTEFLTRTRIFSFS
ncbi:dynein axonemal intermediate chain 7-like [Coccinella septempunctata]|uniref:dynein axonemal intermediate chain 7-like n=1 Tax=Coccinella septempunctata TaxID=41139 RepID=UPI001D07C0B6|nr:dynein axonemal intermediate chain 7-like [Coccinella septempunctata]